MVQFVMRVKEVDRVGLGTLPPIKNTPLYIYIGGTLFLLPVLLPA